MLNHEAIFIGNVKRFSNYSGFSKTLKLTNIELNGHKKDIIAIDAVHFEKSKIQEQY